MSGLNKRTAALGTTWRQARPQIEELSCERANYEVRNILRGGTGGGRYTYIGRRSLSAIHPRMIR